jgi:broad specificity phosphatase PhoE
MLFVRHGPRNRKNSDNVPQRCDGPIIEDSYPHTNILDRYIEEYGFPERIVTSSYQRTRGTAGLLFSYLQSRGVEVPVIIDRNIGEYLSFRAEKADFHPTTYKYNPIIGETLEQFKTRCRNYDSKLGTWYVSHSFFISTHLNERYDIEISSSTIPEFHAIVIND